ncbi:type VII secretion target [Lentzea sp. NPDC034063]|uniref:type VII secretion target n=1 Tax=unclassified Lentzea TaxID=2643253 RepID=UPI0033F8ECE9
MTGFEVEAELLRQHATNVDAILRRFAGVQSASSHITKDDQAYGRLCSWLPGKLDARHVAIDTVIATVESNLRTVVKELHASADTYMAVDADTRENILRAAGAQ